MSGARDFAGLYRSFTQAWESGPWVRYLRSTRSSANKKKPADLIHGLEDIPPPFFTLLAGFQHVSQIRIQLIYPALVIQVADLPTDTSLNLLSLAMIALGIAAILQSLPRGPVGSGYLCPSCHSGIFLEPSLAALKLGGLPLVFGMTILAGVLQSVLSPILRRIRPLLPPEIGGLVVFLVGSSIAAIGIRYLIGVGAKEPVGREYWLVGAVTLMTTVGLNVWGKGQARLFCAMAGMIVGYAVAYLTGELPANALKQISETSLIAIPHLDHGDRKSVV